MAERIFACVKCRWPAPYLDRNRAGETAAAGPAEMRYCGPGQVAPGCTTGGEHLHVTCPRCGWVHRVLCADAPGFEGTLTPASTARVG